MSSGNLAHARERIGRVLRDRWLLERVLGLGGMAAVYRARHRNGARAAIKLLHGPLSEDKVVRERFLREAYLANSIDHPGIVKVLDDDADPQAGPFIVMELLEGESILDLLDRGGTLTIEEALDVADQTLDVLSAAHDRAIVHRDLKPGNLFLCQHGVVKVLDFGIARLLDDSQARLTRTGVPLGTPAYMAPEQARGLGRQVDGRADLYALGATIFRILTGRHVHVGQGAEQIALVATRPAPAIESVLPNLPRGICAIINRALLFDPDARYPTAADMQADVRRVRKGQSPEPQRPMVPTMPRLQTARPVEYEQLADALRAEAHRNAKRPDAFMAPRTVPPPDADDDEDDNLPTMAYQPKQAQAMRDAAFGPRAGTPTGLPRVSAPPPPSTPGKRASTRPLPRPSLNFSNEPSSAAQAFARVPNVPVPNFTPHGGMPSARSMPSAPVAEPQSQPHGGAVVLPAPVPSKFEDTQYQIEGAGRRPSSASMASGPPPSSAPPKPPPRSDPRARFAQTLVDPGSNELTAVPIHVPSTSLRASPGSDPQLLRHAEATALPPTNVVSPFGPPSLQAQPTSSGPRTPAGPSAGEATASSARQRRTLYIVFALVVLLMTIAVVFALTR